MSGDLTFNKYAAAILATALGFMLIKEVSHSAMHAEIPEKPAYGADLVIDDGPSEVEPVDLPFPQSDWVAAMEMTAGEKQFKACKSCHKIAPGEYSNQGPNLYGVVGRAAGTGDYAYSEAMKESGIVWNFEELDSFLEKPKAHVPGTKMSFAGIKKMDKRAAVIEYLRMNADAPMDRPVAAVMVEAPMDELVDPMSADDGSVEQSVEMVVDGVEDELGQTVDNLPEGVEIIVDGIEDELGDMADDAKEAVIEKAEDVVTGDE